MTDIDQMYLMVINLGYSFFLQCITSPKNVAFVCTEYIE